MVWSTNFFNVFNEGITGAACALNTQDYLSLERHTRYRPPDGACRARNWRGKSISMPM